MPFDDRDLPAPSSRFAGPRFSKAYDVQRKI
jgi:hypothetical protein